MKPTGKLSGLWRPKLESLCFRRPAGVACDRGGGYGLSDDGGGGGGGISLNCDLGMTDLLTASVSGADDEEEEEDGAGDAPAGSWSWQSKQSWFKLPPILNGDTSMHSVYRESPIKHFWLKFQFQLTWFRSRRESLCLSLPPLTPPPP